MEGERESKAPVRVRVLFADRKLLSKAQRSEGFRRSWVVIRPDLTTVAEFCRGITSQFGLKSTSGHDLRLWMDGFRIPLFESTSIFKDNDEIRVKGDIKKMKKMESKKAVASPTSVLQINERDSIDTHIIVSSNGVPLVDNGQEATEKKQKKRKRPISEETSSKREQKEAERPNCSKKKKMKPLDNARQATIDESKKAVPAVATPSHCHIVNQKTNTPVLISERYTERNQQVVSISKHTSTGFSGGRDKKNMSGACLGVGIHQSRPLDWIRGQTRFMSPGAGPSNWQENGPRKSFQGDRTMTKKTSRSRSGFNGPNVHDRNWEPWGDSSGPNAISSQPLGTNFATEKPTGKVIPHGEELIGDKYFESFNPPPCLPMQGDIMAFRLDIIDDLGCPGLSSFRVGKVIVFDPVLMIIFIQPVPEYRTPDCEVSEYEKSMYKEDGSLEIGFESLVDLRLIKESKVKITPEMSGKGKSKSKASNRQDERNDNNVNSAWETGNASNAEETTEHSWGAWAPSTGTAGASGQNMVQHGTGFGSQDGKLSNGWNGGGANNSTLAWEANNQAPNSGQGTQAQQNGWDAWEPSTSHAGLSWPRVGQHRSGFGSGSGHSRGGRKGRGGKHFNPKFKK